jgi:hypothetical protein
LHDTPAAVRLPERDVHGEVEDPKAFPALGRAIDRDQTSTRKDARDQAGRLRSWSQLRERDEVVGEFFVGVFLWLGVTGSEHLES